MSRDKILHDSWSISAALARGFADRHFERGEGPGDEVGDILDAEKGTLKVYQKRSFMEIDTNIPKFSAVFLNVAFKENAYYR